MSRTLNVERRKLLRGGFVPDTPHPHVSLAFSDQTQLITSFLLSVRRSPILGLENSRIDSRSVPSLRRAICNAGKASEQSRDFSTLVWLAVIGRLLLNNDHGLLTVFLRGGCLMRRVARSVPPNSLKSPTSCATTSWRIVLATLRTSATGGIVRCCAFLTVRVTRSFLHMRTF